jgi:hypothetical protein
LPSKLTDGGIQFTRPDAPASGRNVQTLIQTISLLFNRTIPICFRRWVVATLERRNQELNFFSNG